MAHIEEELQKAAKRDEEMGKKMDLIEKNIMAKVELQILGQA